MNSLGAAEATPEFRKPIRNWPSYSAVERLEEVRTTGAEAVVSACPYCKDSFKSGLENYDHQVQVFDITEIIAEAL